MTNNNKIKDYSYFLSKRGLLKEVSPIRALFQFSSIEGMISLGGGLPNASTFPFKSMTIELKGSDEKLVIAGSDLDEGLQYSPTPGIPRLNQLLKELQSRAHNVPLSDVNLIISNGSQESLYNAIEILLNEHDSLITETPTYSGTLSILKPLQLNLIGIETDKYGMIPDKLEHVLSTWDHSSSNVHKFPKVIYLIPSGQNPCGSTMNNKRKEQLYQICSKYNLLILEDDPYYYLQFDSQQEQAVDNNETNNNSNNHQDGSIVVNLGKSFLSMDVDGRVLRFDSLSKILSSGLRLGFVTANNKTLIEKINFHQQSSTLHASGISQIIVYKLLTQWGESKWYQHLSSVQQFYREKRNQFIECLETNLKGQIEYNIPSAGMFIWMRLIGINDSKELIFKEAVKAKILLVPGISFSTTPNIPSPYVRASYSSASKEQMFEATKRLSLLLKEQTDKNINN